VLLVLVIMEETLDSGGQVGEGVCLIKKNKRWVAATIK